MRFLLLVTVFAVAASPHANATPAGVRAADTPSLDSERRAISASDALRALVVFVRFKDDDVDWSGGCARSATQWAIGDELPEMAHTILHPTREGPYADSSLTDYFYQQSNGNFLIYGDTHPEVYTTRHDEAHYRRLGAQGLGILTDEIMNALAGRYDFSEYDGNGDGYIDQLMVILRTMREPPPFGGIASLGTADYSRAYNGKKLHPLLGGFYLIWHRSFNVHPQVNLIRWMAHEFGHNLWPQFRGAHLDPIRTNDVPYSSSASESTPHRVVGYALMLGAGSRSADIAGHNIISAYERSLLEGWISCTVLDTSRTVVIGDLYTTSASNCAMIALDGNDSRRRVYLSNLQRIGYFDRNHRPPSAHCDGCFRIDQGLMATGLFAEIVDPSSPRATRDFLPANNAADAPEDCEWPHAHDVYAGNTFGEGSQLTPWTRPNINGFTYYPDGYSPSWQAVDYIRHTGGTNGEMAFDFVSDFRREPVIRSDSWIGRESGNQTITGEMRVLQDAVLTISDTMLKFDEGASIVVDGALIVERATITSDESWRGITISRNGTVSVQNGSELLRMDFDVNVEPGGHLVISDDSTVRRVSR